MARYFAQAQRKDADATKPPGPGYVGAINDEYLKHKITEMMKAFERMTKKVFGQNAVQLTSPKKIERKDGKIKSFITGVNYISDLNNLADFMIRVWKLDKPCYLGS